MGGGSPRDQQQMGWGWGAPDRADFRSSLLCSPYCSGPFFCPATPRLLSRPLPTGPSPVLCDLNSPLTGDRDVESQTGDKGLAPRGGPWLTRHGLGTSNLEGQVWILPWAAWHYNPPAGGGTGGKQTLGIRTQVLKTHPELPPPNPVSRKTHSRRASWKRWQKRVGSEAPKKRVVLKGHLLDNFREWQRPPKVTEEERQRRDWNGNDNQG